MTIELDVRGARQNVLTRNQPDTSKPIATTVKRIRDYLWFTESHTGRKGDQTPAAGHRVDGASSHAGKKQTYQADKVIHGEFGAVLCVGTKIMAKVMLRFSLEVNCSLFLS